MDRPVVGCGGICGEEQLDVFQADIVEPAVGVPVDQAGTLAVGDDVADDHVADRAGGRLIWPAGLPRLSLRRWMVK